MEVKPLNACFGATVTNVNLEGLDEHAFAELYALWLRYALLIFPGQFLSHDVQVEFAKRFGDLEFEYAAISNLNREGTVRGDDDVVKILKGNMEWHCDSTYMPVMAKGAVFSAHVVPEKGGETGWADMRAAYAVLDPKTRDQVDSLSARHSLQHSQAKVGHSHSEQSQYSGYGFHDGDIPVRPLVKQHPETGIKSLLIGRHAYGLSGMASVDSEQLLARLVAEACGDDRTYFHRWSKGDVVVWDNRCLLHRVNDWDMKLPRVMYHSRIAGDPQSEGY
ncbi:MAG: alpha-ketoglutarate-dependent taurine dioxygenase [Candidatus Azotimanducaceae bacterium]|jgi:alpha-ketoglutarate-dependent taurine dioxygenase